MKKYILEATDENILDTIEHDQISRSSDVKAFLELIDTIDDNVFISIDAAWGDGKTFFVRQIEMTMKYHNKKAFQNDKGISDQELKAFQANALLGDLKLQHTYLPIYFDAWLYDNHKDALMALLMVAIKKSGKSIDTTIAAGKIEKLASVMDSIQFWKSDNWSNLLEKHKDKNILEETFLLEDIRQMIKGIFEDILVEDAEKLVIFIDELDRCRPTFAVEMLESIKHYFDDERFIFVMSINKPQLIHTISRYYGEGFGSDLYLNKFFDISIQLPPADTRTYFDNLGISCDSSYWIDQFARELQKKYSLSLRDSTRYLQKITFIKDKFQNNIGDDSWKIMVLFIPVLCVFDIVDISEKNRLLSGNGFDILEKLITDESAMKKYILRLVDKREDTEENFCEGMNELKTIYHYVFATDNYYGWYQGRLDIPANLKRKCLRICNVV